MRSALLVLPLLVAALPAQQRADSAQAISLAEAIARGRGAGVQSALASLTVRQAETRAAQRGADRLPAVTTTVSAERQTVNLDEFGVSFGEGGTTDPFSVFRARVGARQLIFDRAVFDRMRLTRDSVTAAGFDARRVGDLSAAMAGSAWLRLASALETVKARENDSVTAVALRDIAGAQVDAGTAARIERTRSESQLATIRSLLSLARLSVERARLDLARVLDLPAGTAITPSGDPALVLDAPPTTTDAAVALALANRPDLAAERERALLAERAITAIRHEFLPTIGAQGYAQTSGVDLGRMSTSWNIGVGLSWTPFDGFRRERRIDEQLLRRDAQLARVHDLEQQVTADARGALLDLASAGEQLTLANERVRLAEQEVSEARERLAAGVTGTTETTRAQGELTAARDNLIQARVSAGAAQLGAAAAFGLLDRIH